MCFPHFWWEWDKGLLMSKKGRVDIWIIWSPQKEFSCFFPTCQVRVVRFYVSCLLLLLLLLLRLLLPRPPLLLLLVLLVVLVVLAQLRPAIHSVLCRTSTTTIHAQCSLPDLNHDHPRPMFPAGPQPRPPSPSVPCRTSTTTIHAQCSLPDLNREYPRQVFPAGPHVGRYGTKNVQKKVRKNVRKNVRRYVRRYARRYAR